MHSLHVLIYLRAARHRPPTCLWRCYCVATPHMPVALLLRCRPPHACGAATALPPPTCLWRCYYVVALTCLWRRYCVAAPHMPVALLLRCRPHMPLALSLRGRHSHAWGAATARHSHACGAATTLPPLPCLWRCHCVCLLSRGGSLHHIFFK